MKRLLCLLIVMMLMLCCAGAQGDAADTETPGTDPADERDADLLDLWQTDGESRRWITAAVQTMNAGIALMRVVLAQLIGLFANLELAVADAVGIASY